MTETTTDRFLDGRLTVRQPAHGFRAGLDAVVLAAAVPALSKDRVLELGSGSGAASLCLAARVFDCDVTGIEIDKGLVSLASTNAIANGLQERVRFVEGDVLARPAALRTTFSHVFANPPFHHPAEPSSANELRRSATRDAMSLDAWLAAGLRRVEPGGTVTLILRTDRLIEVLPKCHEGGVTLIPLWARKNEPAKRTIVQVKKGSHARLRLLPGLVLHELDGSFTSAAESILRSGRALSVSPETADG